MSRAEGISSSSASKRRSCKTIQINVEFLPVSNINLKVGASSGSSDNQSLVAVEQPEEEVDGEDGKIEGEEEQSLEEEGTQGDDDAGGADVEVEHKTQPGAVALHRVGDKAEEKGEGEHQEERHHQELHEELAILQFLELLLCRGGHVVRTGAA